MRKGEVTKVAISTDNGMHWSDAHLLGKPMRHTWRLWEYEWMTPAWPGRCVLMARATDEQGHVQPMKRAEDLRDAMISHVQPIKVEVR